MIKILADATLPHLSRCFPKPFAITPYNTPLELQTMLPDHDVLLCRSTLRVNAALLTHSAIQCVATASSGTDHIDQEVLTSKNIHLFDAKGSNAQAVADYVTATLAWLELNQKITGKRVGLIGAGAVGTQVLQRLMSAGYEVSIYDPYKTSTLALPHAHSLMALSQCDVLCIHPNLHHQTPYPSFNLINADFLSTLKPGVTIINASRGGIVNESDLLNAEHPIHYCTDVFIGEPNINPDIVDFAVLCTPHIAGHSIEAKRDAIIQLSQQLHTYFNLPSPVTLSTSEVLQPDFFKINAWQPQALQHYNPYEETRYLKTQPDKKTAFITQRNEHTHRHHFAVQRELCYI